MSYFWKNSSSGLGLQKCLKMTFNHGVAGSSPAGLTNNSKGLCRILDRRFGTVSAKRLQGLWS
jgi:hypothetical protein